MARRSRSVSADKPILECDRWPTSTTLARTTIIHLDAVVAALRATGAPVRRRDVVALLVLYPRIEDPLAQARSIEEHRAAELRRSVKPLMLELPSPVSLRLDLLVDGVRQLGVAVYRRDLLGALISAEQPGEIGRLSELLDRYRGAAAGDAAVAGHELGEVLRTRRSPAGPRPMPV